MYDEEDLLPISALQHLIFCERRAALICLENLWNDNIFTVEGSMLHEQAHDMETERRGNIRIVRGLWLRSFQLGLYGKADVTEFHLIKNAKTNGISLPNLSGLWQPLPIEYKRGRLRREKSFEIQLCAQAICLEEMTGASIDYGAIYYGKTRRRFELKFDKLIREQTINAANHLHELTSHYITPLPVLTAKCRSCSMFELCLPKAISRKKSQLINDYLNSIINNMEY